MEIEHYLDLFKCKIKNAYNRQAAVHILKNWVRWTMVKVLD